MQSMCLFLFLLPNIYFTIYYILFQDGLATHQNVYYIIHFYVFDSKNELI